MHASPNPETRLSKSTSVAQRTQSLGECLLLLLRRPNFCLCGRGLLQILLQIHASLVCGLCHEPVHVFLGGADRGGRRGNVLVQFCSGIDVFKLFFMSPQMSQIDRCYRSTDVTDPYVYVCYFSENLGDSCGTTLRVQRYITFPALFFSAMSWSRYILINSLFTT